MRHYYIKALTDKGNEYYLKEYNGKDSKFTANIEKAVFLTNDRIGADILADNLFNECEFAMKSRIIDVMVIRKTIINQH